MGWTMARGTARIEVQLGHAAGHEVGDEGLTLRR
jgi:hypothetical protein